MFIYNTFEETMKWIVGISKNNSGMMDLAIEDELFDVLPSHPYEPEIIIPKCELVIEKTFDTH